LDFFLLNLSTWFSEKGEESEFTSPLSSDERQESAQSLTREELLPAIHSETLTMRRRSRRRNRKKKWGRWDLNPDQRVSTTRGATPRELTGHRSSYSSPFSVPVGNHTQLTGAREDAVLPHTPMMIIKPSSSSAAASGVASSSCAISNAASRVSSMRVSFFSS